MRLNRSYPGHWEFFHDDEAKYLSFENGSSIRAEVFASTPSITESPAPKIVPGR